MAAPQATVGLDDTWAGAVDAGAIHRVVAAEMTRPTPQEVDAAIAWLDNYCRSFRGESCLDNGSDCGCMKAHRAVGVLRALSAAPAVAPIERYRHRKTGGIYRWLIGARMEATKQLAVVYESETTGERWIRPATEFHDGRFERIADAAPQVAPPRAAQDVIAERQRQVTQEGWSLGHDDEHDRGEMALAAGCYAFYSCNRNRKDTRPPPWWPWDDKWWKPSEPRRELVKAGALILAEIERLDRAAPQVAPAPPQGQIMGKCKKQNECDSPKICEMEGRCLRNNPPQAQAAPSGDAELIAALEREESAISAIAADRIAAQAERVRELERDAERFVWWFDDSPKPPNIVNQYLQGIREHWSVDQWRATIDAAKGGHDDAR